MEPDKSNSTNN